MKHDHRKTQRWLLSMMKNSGATQQLILLSNMDCVCFEINIFENNNMCITYCVPTDELKFVFEVEICNIHSGGPNAFYKHLEKARRWYSDHQLTCIVLPDTPKMDAFFMQNVVHNTHWMLEHKDLFPHMAKVFSKAFRIVKKEPIKEGSICHDLRAAWSEYDPLSNMEYFASSLDHDLNKAGKKNSDIVSRLATLMQVVPFTKCEKYDADVDHMEGWNLEYI